MVADRGNLGIPSEISVGIVTPHKLQGYGVSVRLNREIYTYKKYSVPVTIFSLVENGLIHGCDVVSVSGILGKVTEVIGFDRLVNSESVVRKLFLANRIKKIAKSMSSKIARVSEKRKVTVFHCDDFLGSIISLNVQNQMKSNPLIIGEFADLIHLDFKERFGLKDADKLIINVREMLCETLEKMDFAFFVSPIDRDIAVKELGIAKNRTCTLYEAADKKAPCKLKYRLTPSYVCYLGILAKWEYPHLLIESYRYACANRKNLVYSIIGAGPLFKQMKKMAKDLGSRIIFYGWHPNSEALRIASDADLGVIPTLKVRAMPSKLFVYASLGLPMISMDGMWWSERFIRHYDIGYSAAHSPEDLGNAIKTALNNPSELEEKGKRARKLIEEKYNWDLRTKKMLKVYEKLLGMR
jgi:glycosyltransferase involved in cell wall biosynthesis